MDRRHFFLAPTLLVMSGALPMASNGHARRAPYWLVIAIDSDRYANFVTPIWALEDSPVVKIMAHDTVVISAVTIMRNLFDGEEAVRFPLPDRLRLGPGDEVTLRGVLIH